MGWGAEGEAACVGAVVRTLAPTLSEVRGLGGFLAESDILAGPSRYVESRTEGGARVAWIVVLATRSGQVRIYLEDKLFPQRLDGQSERGVKVNFKVFGLYH